MGEVNQTSRSKSTEVSRVTRRLSALCRSMPGIFWLTLGESATTLTPMSRSVRVAIAGTGFIGGVHARSARLAGARVVSVAASSPQSAEAAAVALHADRAAASAEELVQDMELDVVHICTPNHLHQALAAAALAAGKHVVCEKPLA